MADELYSVPDDLDLGVTLRGFITGQLLFDRYVLERILGRGGMGVVWLAVDEKLERHVAMKFLPELIKLDSAALTDLKRETRRSLELTHPNIVRIYDFVDDNTAAAISMEYIDGQTLSAWRVQQPGHIFEVEQIHEWTGQLVDALVYAHTDARVVHRDLKPANLMIDSRGRLKVADFGISRSINDSVSRVTIRDGSSGTLAYMSPQQALGKKPTTADDIYSLGATLYELLTGKPPFYSGDIVTQLREIIPPSMTERRIDLEIEGATAVIPEAWEQTVAACLEKDPTQRPQSMLEVAERLGLRAASAPASPLPSLPPIEPATPPVFSPSPKSRKPLLFGALGAALLLVGGLIYYYGVTAPAESARQAAMAQEVNAPQTGVVPPTTDSPTSELPHERAEETPNAPGNSTTKAIEPSMSPVTVSPSPPLDQRVPQPNINLEKNGDAPPQAPIQPGSPFILLKALWGAEDTWVDVRPKIQAMLASGNSTIYANGGVLGDPVFGKMKSLQLTYSLNGQTYSQTIGENAFFNVSSQKVLPPLPMSGLPSMNSLPQMASPPQTGNAPYSSDIAQVVLTMQKKAEETTDGDPDFRLVEVRCGNNSSWKDVTSIMQNMVQNNSINRNISQPYSVLGGDPAPGQVKKMIIAYRYHSQAKTVVLEETFPSGFIVELP